MIITNPVRFLLFIIVVSMVYGLCSNDPAPSPVVRLAAFMAAN